MRKTTLLNVSVSMAFMETSQLTIEDLSLLKEGIFLEIFFLSPVLRDILVVAS